MMLEQPKNLSEAALYLVNLNQSFLQDSTLGRYFHRRLKISFRIVLKSSQIFWEEK